MWAQDKLKLQNIGQLQRGVCCSNMYEDGVNALPCPRSGYNADACRAVADNQDAFC